jgi:NarL family two-component system response regulator LiaR
MNQTRVLIVDDHAIVRKGIWMFLSTEPSIQMVGEAVDGQDAIGKAKSLRPDVILMDLVMPNGDGIEAIAKIKRCTPNVKIVVLTTFGDEARVNAAIEAGADGYLLKDADGEVLLQAIHAVQEEDMPLHPRVARHLVKGDVARHRNTNRAGHLTDREKDVLRLMVKGLSNKGIAQDLNLSEGTVKVHVSNILSKLNVSSRTEAAVRAIQMGLISSDEET